MHNLWLWDRYRAEKEAIKLNRIIVSSFQVQIEIHAVIAPELAGFISVGFSGVDIVDSELFLGDCGLFIGQGNVQDSLIQVRNVKYSYHRVATAQGKQGI